MQFCRLTAVRMTDTTNGSPDARASSHGSGWSQLTVSTQPLHGYGWPGYGLMLTRRPEKRQRNPLFVYLSLQATNGGCIKDLVPPELKIKCVYYSLKKPHRRYKCCRLCFSRPNLISYYYRWSWLHTSAQKLSDGAHLYICKYIAFIVNKWLKKNFCRTENFH